MAGCQSTVSSTEDVLVRPKRHEFSIMWVKDPTMIAVRWRRAFRSAIQKHMALCNCQSKWPLFVNCKWRISYLQLGAGSIINLEKNDDAYGKFKIDTRCRQSHTMF
uniref:Uncharacterized protein n=1 Tax=Oryza meridionalis TaxID=40149 RepID=A0A0E0DH43_9ORYZ